MNCYCVGVMTWTTDSKSAFGVCIWGSKGTGRPLGASSLVGGVESVDPLTPQDFQINLQVF